MKLTFNKLRVANTARGKERITCNLSLSEDLSFRGNEMAGEVGEACNIIKKMARSLYGVKGERSIESSKQDLADELADVVICTDRVAELMDIDLGLAVKDKFNKTSDKHGYTTRILNGVEGAPGTVGMEQRMNDEASGVDLRSQLGRVGCKPGSDVPGTFSGELTDIQHPHPFPVVTFVVVAFGGFGLVYVAVSVLKHFGVM